MSGIVYLAALIATIVVIYWAYRNDASGNSGRTTGLLAMRRPPDDGKAPAPPPARSRFSRPPGGGAVVGKPSDAASSDRTPDRFRSKT